VATALKTASPDESFPRKLKTNTCFIVIQDLQHDSSRGNRLHILSFDGRGNTASCQAGRDFVSDVYLHGIFEEFSRRVENQGVTALQNCKGRQRLKLTGELIGSRPALQK
jgi:hypothetical protein